MSINIQIQKKDLLLLSAIIVFLVGVGYVIAWGSNNPRLHGHDIGEIEGIIGGSGGVSFGDWVSIASSIPAYPYKIGGPVATDGFIVAYGGLNSHLFGETSTDGVTFTKRIAHNVASSGSGIPGITMPVRKGEYWRVGGYNVISEIFWIPLEGGSGGGGGGGSPTFINPVTVYSGKGEDTWQTFDASSYVPEGTTTVILEGIAYSGDIQIRKDVSSSGYLLAKWLTAINGFSVGQGIFPIASDRTFEYKTLGQGTEIKLIGYF